MLFSKGFRKFFITTTGVGTATSFVIPYVTASGVDFKYIGSISLNEGGTSTKKEQLISLMTVLFNDESKTFWFSFYIKDFVQVGANSTKFYVSFSKNSNKIIYYDEKNAKAMKHIDVGYDSAPTNEDGYYDMITGDYKMPKHIVEGKIISEDKFKELNKVLSGIFKSAKKKVGQFEGQMVPAVEWNSNICHSCHS